MPLECTKLSLEYEARVPLDEGLVRLIRLLSLDYDRAFPWRSSGIANSLRHLHH